MWCTAHVGRPPTQQAASQTRQLGYAPSWRMFLPARPSLHAPMPTALSTLPTTSPSSHATLPLAVFPTPYHAWSLYCRPACQAPPELISLWRLLPQPRAHCGAPVAAMTGGSPLHFLRFLESSSSRLADVRLRCRPAAAAARCLKPLFALLLCASLPLPYQNLTLY
jgi:hypothetical protein